MPAKSRAGAVVAPIPGPRKEGVVMPLYEYRCKKCAHVMEVLESADASGPHKCEKCGSRRTEKIVSVFGVGASNQSSSGSCPTGTCPLS